MNDINKEEKLTTIALKEFDEMNSDVQPGLITTTGKSDTVHATVTSTTPNQDKGGPKEDGFPSDNTNSRFDGQFYGNVSNTSQRASMELTSGSNTKTKRRNHRRTATRSAISISSVCAETDASIVQDPLARPSKRMKKSCNRVLSDGDVWVEKVLKSRKTGRKRSFFYSVKTGDRTVDEPPTGSSKVIYTSSPRY